LSVGEKWGGEQKKKQCDEPTFVSFHGGLLGYCFEAGKSSRSSELYGNFILSRFEIKQGACREEVNLRTGSHARQLLVFVGWEPLAWKIRKFSR
jgi:hypothetical protein